MCNENCVFSDVKKIKVSREVADAIERIKGDKLDFETIISNQIRGCWRGDEYVSLKGLTTTQLATALINGYKVELTPHEKIAKEYADAEQERLAGIDAEDTCLIYQNLGIKMGIEFTLNALGVVVEGVNDN